MKTGFRAALIGGALGATRKPLGDVRFVDRALARQVPCDAPGTPIPSTTIATAHEAGWTWDIGLQDRRGVGDVHSSRHTDDACAERVLRRYVGQAADGRTPRALVLPLGYRETQWVGNCVAVGLAAGFLEPLESSGIGLIETAAHLIAHVQPADGDFAPVARRFNAAMTGCFERVVDFLKPHYALSRRTDGAFWRDNADPASWTPSLRDKLAPWRSRPPHRLDFTVDLEMYPPSSWQYVLYSLGYATDLSASRAAWPDAARAQHEFAMIARVAERALADLPPHRALVEAIRARAAAPAGATISDVARAAGVSIKTVSRA